MTSQRIESDGFMPSQIANFFLRKKKCSNMKVNKLVFIAYGVNLYKRAKRLTDERAKVWKYGPVFKSLYEDFKRAIPQGEDSKSLLNRLPCEDKDYSEEVLDVLNMVWNVYGDWEASQLVTQSHKQGTPWSKALERASLESDGEIPKDLEINDIEIYSYYKVMHAAVKMRQSIGGQNMSVTY